MQVNELMSSVAAAWNTRDSLSPATQGPVREAVAQALALLDRGEVRVAEKKDGRWVVHEWLKKAVLLSFQ